MEVKFMNVDKIEIITQEILAITKLWNLLRGSSGDFMEKEDCEELLLKILEETQKELSNCLK